MPGTRRFKRSIGGTTFRRTANASRQRKINFNMRNRSTNWMERLAAATRTAQQIAAGAQSLWNRYNDIASSRGTGHSVSSASRGPLTLSQLGSTSAPMSLGSTNASSGAFRNYAFGGVGRSAGFIKTKLKAKKLKKVTRKVQNKGIYKTREIGGVLSTAGEMGIVGHSTTTLNLLVEAMTLALVKTIMHKHNTSVPDVRRNMVSEYLYQENDVFQIIYSTTVNPTTLSLISHSVITSDTPESVANGLATQLWTLQSHSELVFHYVRFNPTMLISPNTHPQIHINLVGARFHWDIKSSLKIQNRTITAVGDDNALDVNNAPLYGKGYSGTGSGSRFVTPYTNNTTLGTPPVGNYLGLIALGAPILVNEGIQEPPQPNMFTDCKSYGKVRIEPGAIQTSVLVHRSSSTLDKLWRDLIVSSTVGTSTTALRYRHIGKFRFMALEKMINSTLGEPGIQIAYELNIRYGGYFTFSFSKKTHEVFQKTYV